MKSFRNLLRKAVLAVPVAAIACTPRASGTTGTQTTSTSSNGTTSASGITSGSGGSGVAAGHNLCDTCVAQGLICNPWATGCIDPNTTSTTATTTGGGTTGTNASTTGTGTSGSTVGSTGSTGDPCPIDELCPVICDCTRATFTQAPLPDNAQADPDTGQLNRCDCNSACPAQIDAGIYFTALTSCTLDLPDAGAPDGGPLWNVTCYYTTLCTGVGRRPNGLVEPTQARASNRESELGAYLASAAHLEAASVVAFRRMARELSAFGAPTKLIEKARRAAREEVQHARMIRRLANRFGAAPLPVEVAPAKSRSLEAFAIENAVEGCVGETFGAAVTTWQSLHAADAEIREASSTICEDESGHAELAWEIHAWAMQQLSAEARTRVVAALDASVHELEHAEPAREELARIAGVPSTAEHHGLIASLRTEIWA